MAQTLTGPLAVVRLDKDRPAATPRPLLEKGSALFSRKLRCRACDAKLLSSEQTDGACRSCVDAVT